MKKETFNHLDLNIYSETLENGLKVYIIPKDNVNNIYATFSTAFGATYNEFIPIGQKQMIKVPDGVAHFLEHQLFNQKDGKDPLNVFTSNGANGNANTSYFKTTYLFAGIENFKENLTCLLDFVQEPYFTDESVLKEKGIIEQEINMYLDDPYSKSYEVLNHNAFHNHPIKDNVIGSVKSINAITKEDLYTCYNTFYHPSNMFIVITGNINPKKTIEIIKNNQAKKHFDKIDKIVVKTYEEPDTVVKKQEIVKMNVTIPKVLIGFKINMKQFDVEEHVLRWYLSIYANIKFGTTSIFWEKLKKENIVTDYIGYSLVSTDDHAFMIFDNETKEIDTFINELKEEIKNIDVEEEEFNRKKKSFLSSIVYMSDNIYSLNKTAMSNIIDIGKVQNDVYDKVLKLNYEEFKNIISKINFDNNTTVIVEPKDNN